MKKIQTVCGFGCGSSLLLRMKIQDVLKEQGLEADVFCGEVGTANATPCDAIFTSAELADRIKERASVPVIVINSFVDKKEITDKVLQYFQEEGM